MTAKFVFLVERIHILESFNEFNEALYENVTFYFLIDKIINGKRDAHY